MTSATVRRRDIVRLQSGPTSVCTAVAQQWVSRAVARRSRLEQYVLHLSAKNERERERERERLLVNWLTQQKKENNKIRKRMSQRLPSRAALDWSNCFRRNGGWRVARYPTKPPKGGYGPQLDVNPWKLDRSTTTTSDCWCGKDIEPGVYLVSRRVIWRAELRRIRNKFVVEYSVLVVIDTGNLATVETLEDGRYAVQNSTGSVHRLGLMASQQRLLVQLLLPESAKITKYTTMKMKHNGTNSNWSPSRNLYATYFLPLPAKVNFRHSQASYAISFAEPSDARPDFNWDVLSLWQTTDTRFSSSR